MKAIFHVFLCALFFEFIAAVSYERYKVYKINPKTEQDREFLAKFKNDKNFDFWNEINTVGIPVSIMVSPKVQDDFEKTLTTLGIDHEVLIEDVEKTIQKERDYHLKKRPLKKGRIAFDKYLQHDEMNAYLDQLAKDYPDTVSVETIGQSYEKRDMNLVRISSGPSNGANPKPAIFIDGGIHAREWISGAVALYIINQLTENPDNSNLLDTVDWIILPSVNPDGYEFTWSTNRLWRKTLSPGTLCDGVDANRNFDFHWMESGADSWECSESYAGPEPLSEIEIRNLKTFLTNNKDTIKAYVNLHSYSQMILIPYAYAKVYPDNKDELEEVGALIANAIKAVDGTKYQVGSPPSILYPAAGGTIDWVVAPEPEGAGIELSYAIELPGGGFFGFDLPADQILPVVQETFEGFKALHGYVAENYA